MKNSRILCVACIFNMWCIITVLSQTPPPSLTPPDLTPIATNCGESTYAPDSAYGSLLETGLSSLFNTASLNFKTSPLDLTSYLDVWYTHNDTGATGQLIWLAAKCYQGRQIKTQLECRLCLMGVRNNLKELCPYKESAEQVVADCFVRYQNSPWTS